MLGSARGRWCNPTGLLTRGSFETPIFAQLQDDPEGIRLPSYVAVQDLPPVVLFTLCHTTSDGCVLI